MVKTEGRVALVIYARNMKQAEAGGGRVTAKMKGLSPHPWTTL